MVLPTTTPGVDDASMSRARRLTVIAVAWVVPVVWVAGALFAGPSDGTVLSSAHGGAGRDGGASVARALGDGPLRPGDTVLAIEGRSVGQWLETASPPERLVGEVVTYEVRRPAPGLDRILDLDVTLVRFPLADAIVQDVAAVAVCLVLLLTGSAVFWRRPGATAARAFLAGTAGLPAVLTSAPWGIGAIDLAGSRGTWPQVGGEALAALGVGCVFVAVAALAPADAWRRRYPSVILTALLVPWVGYAVWLAVALGRAGSPGERLQVIGTVFGPAVVATIPVLLSVVAFDQARASRREDVLATRLVLLGVVSGVGAWLLLDPVPRWLTGETLLPRQLLLLVVLTAVVGCVGSAIAHYRLGEIEPKVRRGLVQAVVLVVVAAAFTGLVRAADLAADVSVGSMLTGGLAALVLLPVAVWVQRTLRRMVYGDREFPRRVVADLRRLDPLTAPEDALGEMLELLSRRLHLSFAAVEVFATPTSEAISTAVGTSYGTPATIDLVVGRTTLGRLMVEVDAAHDPFGPGDRRLLEDVGTQAGALVQAVSVNRELQRSRQRLVTAREEERRRIRRDLHDGLGPSLATLAMRLEGAQELIAEDPRAAADLVGRLSDQARDEIAEVRRLVEGLRPPALDQLGLVTALRQRAAEQGRGARQAMAWTVEASDDVDPLPAAVEVAAYRIAIEAVNNAQRHSRADECRVLLRREPEELVVTIRDAGTGLAPDRPSGVGLSSMRERAEELGGSFEVFSEVGTGTTIRARLPILADTTREQ